MNELKFSWINWNERIIIRRNNSAVPLRNNDKNGFSFFLLFYKIYIRSMWHNDERA